MWLPCYLQCAGLFSRINNELGTPESHYHRRAGRAINHVVVDGLSRCNNHRSAPFVLHTNQFLGTLQKFNLWIVAGSPLFLWLVIICLRSWLYNHAMDKHQFESDEAEYAQQQWTNWAGRYLAVLYSRVILPAELTPARFIQSPAELEQSNALGRRIALPLGENVFSALLGGLEESLIQLCADLPFGVTLLTDASDPEDHLQKAFSAAWIQHFGLTLSAPFLTILNTRSFSSVEERIKTPTLDVELLLIHQMQGATFIVMRWQLCY